MQIHAPQNAHLLLNGDIYDDFARWSDSNDGTKIYVGQAMPRSTVNFVGIVHSALPPAISGLMSASLPELMRFCGQHLPELAQRPMLFVSYDPDYEHGHGRQGGTLPNQVFMHFYGPTWQETDMDGDTPIDIGWFFAHETGQMFFSTMLRGTENHLGFTKVLLKPSHIWPLKSSKSSQMRTLTHAVNKHLKDAATRSARERLPRRTNVAAFLTTITVA
jgi:hypothetical protein